MSLISMRSCLKMVAPVSPCLPCLPRLPQRNLQFLELVYISFFPDKAIKNFILLDILIITLHYIITLKKIFSLENHIRHVFHMMQVVHRLASITSCGKFEVSHMKCFTFCSGIYVQIKVYIPSRAGRGLQCSAQSGIRRS